MSAPAKTAAEAPAPAAASGIVPVAAEPPPGIGAEAAAALLERAGAGLALIDPAVLSVRACNRAFAEAFSAVPFAVALAASGAAEEAAGRIAEDGEAKAELPVKRGRRQLRLAVTLRAAPEGLGGWIAEATDVTRIRETEAMLETYSAMVERRARELAREKERVDKLLLNRMPRSVYEEFKTFGFVTPQLYDPVSVLMLAFVGFTEMAVSADPAVTASELNDIFSAFDRIAEQFGCERIKTTGDADIAVAGLPHPNPDHARAVARCALRFTRYLERRNRTHAHAWRCRIGLATGAVVGSVVGVQKYVCDVFGPAVNLAARLQARAEPMGIAVHGAMAAELADEGLVEPMGEAELRGFGRQPLFRLVPGGEGGGLGALF